MRRLAALFISIGFVAVACVPAPPPEPVDCNATPKPFVDLSGCDLSGRDFSGANLYGAKMQRTHLSDAIFHGADLTNANLSYSTLAGAIFGYDPDDYLGKPQANLTNTNMSNTTGASFETDRRHGREPLGSHRCLVQLLRILR